MGAGRARRGAEPSEHGDFWVNTRSAILIGMLALMLGGCATGPVLQPANDRAFGFPEDTFAFNNELLWEYQIDDATGVMRTVRREPKPDYTQHCYVLARSARQFFQFAKFDSSRPKIKDASYRQLIAEVISHDPSETESGARVLIPGYANLRSFSTDKEALLKAELGGAILSYLQRGNWRMVFPYWSGHRLQTAESLLAEVKVNRPPLLHLATFPRETINHAVLVFGAEDVGKEIRFKIYDPNNAAKATTLVYDRKLSQFYFPASAYFIGGRVDAYEIYKTLIY